MCRPDGYLQLDGIRPSIARGSPVCAHKGEPSRRGTSACHAAASADTPFGGLERPTHASPSIARTALQRASDASDFPSLSDPSAIRTLSKAGATKATPRRSSVEVGVLFP